MNLSKNIFKIVTLSAVLALTACSTKTNSAVSNTTQSSSSSETAGETDPELNDLYQQENQLFADHKEAWDKAFNMMNKGNADPSADYAEYLASAVEGNKDEFTEEEYKTLTEDLEKIREIEKKIAELESKQSTSSSSEESSSESSFANLSGVDFDGNKVDKSLFSKNAVTVLNFWFTGCKPCVEELPKLNELNEAIKAKGGEVVGINTDTFNGSGSAIKDAKKVLEQQGAKYRNLSIDSSCDVGQYASNIMAFPTTILVDRNGKIVGDPLLGGVDNQENYDALMKQIESVIAADSAAK